VTAVIGRIKACLNGGRETGDHPAVPVTPAQLAAAAAGAVAAGAQALHLHPRGPGGSESLDAGDVGAAVAAARSAGVPVGVSTGLWMTRGDPARRRLLVHGWADLAPHERPDFASVNVREPGFAGLVAVLADAGIAAEAGVWSVDDAERLPDVDLERVLIEVVVAPAAEAAGTADAIAARLDSRGITTPRLLHGEGDACWPLVAHAGRLGLPTRIGLEDTLVNPDGTPATDNADLVRRALELWTAAGAQAGRLR
jgi:uncharacterized protein (DUF849 family)